MSVMVECCSDVAGMVRVMVAPDIGWLFVSWAVPVIKTGWLSMAGFGLVSAVSVVSGSCRV